MLSQSWPATAGIIAALITAAAAVTKKFISRKSHNHSMSRPKPEHHSDLVSRSEFHQHLDSLRDRIGASYLALAEKIDLNHTQLLTALEHHRSDFEHRLDRLDTAVARLDERSHPFSL